MTWLEEYHDLIERREVVTGYWIRQAVRNLIEDLEDPRWVYDTTESDKRIRFQETLCRSSSCHGRKPGGRQSTPSGTPGRA